MIHWLNVEYWAPSWPNIFSPNIWTLAGLALHLAVTVIHRERLHRDMKQHVTNAAAPKEPS